VLQAEKATKVTSKKPSAAKTTSDAKQHAQKPVSRNTKAATVTVENDDDIDIPRPTRPMVRRGAISAEAFHEEDLDKMTIDRKVIHWLRINYCILSIVG
jgi:hypothetical protein